MISAIMRTALLLLLLTFVVPVVLPAQQADDDGPEMGPAEGSLVIVGGAMRSDTIVRRFIELAGGPDVPIVVIPTAGGRPEYSDRAGDFLRQHGATNVTVLHTYDREVADSDDFVAPLRAARGVWFGGGRQWRLVDVYGGTQSERLFHEVLQRGGVIGGSSAGATIQGEYLVRGDTRNNQIMMGDHEAGFAFLKGVAIDQHVLARNRQFDLYELVDQRPDLLGIGIDENTAIIVRGDQFEVLGESYVLIYDGNFWSREGSDLKNLPPQNRRFYFLRPGDRYDMKLREVIAK